MAALVTQTIKEMNPLTVFPRGIGKDPAGIKERVDTYGNFIWALARKFTATTEEAEAAMREIFIDIWRYAEHCDKSQSSESVLIAQIARRRLIKHLQ